MNRDELLKKLRKYKETRGKHYQLIKIGIFGSMAKGTAHENSDIDIVVEQEKPDLFVLGSVKVELEAELGRKVDIIRLRDGMNRFLRERIEQEAVYV